MLTPVLSRFWDEPEPWTLQTYLRHDGYQALRTALAMKPDDVACAAAAAPVSPPEPSGRSFPRMRPGPVPSPSIW